MVEFVFFCIAGTAGFVVDYSVVMILGGAFSLHPLVARIFSFICAAYTTWVINTILTFSKRGYNHLKLSHFFAYLATMVIGLSVNYAVYAVLLFLLKDLATYLQVFFAMACGTLAGLALNFLSCSKLLFKKR